jgi:hypothetical protein
LPQDMSRVCSLKYNLFYKKFKLLQPHLQSKPMNAFSVGIPFLVVKYSGTEIKL